MHKTTIQYLGSLYLLSKDIPRFKATLETFYGTPALPSVLPVCFQTMVVTGCSDDGDEVLQSQYGYVQFKLYKSIYKLKTFVVEFGHESILLSAKYDDVCLKRIAVVCRPVVIIYICNVYYTVFV